MLLNLGLDCYVDNRNIGNNMWPSRELTYVMNCLFFCHETFFFKLRILALPGIFDFQLFCPGTYTLRSLFATIINFGLSVTIFKIHSKCSMYNQCTLLASTIVQRLHLLSV